MKKKYDSSVIFLYVSGNEHLLPSAFRKQIPYTTISNWRKTDYSKYVGHEFRRFFDRAFDSAEVAFENYKLKSAMMAFARSWIALSDTLLPVIKDANDTKLKKTVLESIHRR